MRRSVLALLAVVAWLATGSLPTAQQPPVAEFERFLATQLKLTPADRARVRQGEPFVTQLPGAVEREVAVAGLVRIAAPAERTVAAIRDIEQFERGKGFLQTRRISTPPRVDDFASFHVDDQDFAALRTCRPGHCDVKLGHGAFRVLATLDWRSPTIRAQVDALSRTQAVELVSAYQRGGNAELAVYEDGARPTFVAQEFVDLVTRTSQLPAQMPALADFLIHYPRVAQAGAFEDFFYWSLAEFGLKPVFRINHVVIYHVPQLSPVRYVIAIKQLYANHYFHTGLDVRAMVDDDERPGGHYLLMLTVARSDGLTGLFGGMVKSKVQAGGRAGTLAALRNTRRIVEQAP